MGGKEVLLLKFHPFGAKTFVSIDLPRASPAVMNGLAPSELGFTCKFEFKIELYGWD
jgi:hypothetical protein